LLTEHIDELRAAFRETRRHHPFTTDAMVVLPDHLHAVWTLPEGDADFATCWRLIKSAFSRSLATDERISESRAAKRRTRHLAAALLGAYHSRRERFCASRRLHPYQPGQASACAAGQGLAVFVVPSYGEARDVSLRTGQAMSGITRGILASGRKTRSTVMGFASAQPILRAKRWTYGVQECR
jgi:hypothetical protein